MLEIMLEILSQAVFVLFLAGGPLLAEHCLLVQLIERLLWRKQTLNASA